MVTRSSPPPLLAYSSSHRLSGLCLSANYCVFFRRAFTGFLTLPTVPSLSTILVVHNVHTSSTAFADHCYLLWPCLNLLIRRRSSITSDKSLFLNKVCQQRCFSMSIKSRLNGLATPPKHLFLRWWWFLPGVLPLDCLRWLPRLRCLRSLLLSFLLLLDIATS